MVDEVVALDEFEDVEEVATGGPGGEGKPGGSQRKAESGGDGEGVFHVGVGVAFVEDGEEVIVDGFEGGGDEGEAAGAEAGKNVGVFEEVLDFDGGVEGDGGVALVELRR